MNLAPWNDPSIRWVCEDHPTKEQGHRVWLFWECGGAGMPDPQQIPSCYRNKIHFPGNFEWCKQCRMCRRCGRKHGEYERC